MLKDELMYGNEMQEEEAHLLETTAQDMAGLPAHHKRQAITRAIERHPNNIVLWHMFAVFLHERREYEAAALAFEKALALNPNHVPSLDGYEALHRARGHMQAADEMRARGRQARGVVKLGSPSTNRVSTRREAEALLDAAGFTSSVDATGFAPACASGGFGRT
jgi:tetratricopeptide (TPR) repeat protein